MEAKISRKQKAGIIATLLLVGTIISFSTTTLAHPPQPEPHAPVQYEGNVTVALNATDPGVPSSGVAYTVYSVWFISEGAATPDSWIQLTNWTNYTQPLVFSAGGGYQIHFYSVDNCGNRETEKFDYFVIVTDRTAPVTTITISGQQINPPTVPPTG